MPGCKSTSKFELSSIKTTDALIPLDGIEVEFHRPFDDESVKAPDAAVLYQKLQESGVKTSGVSFESWAMPDGERLFTIRDQGKSIPIASIKGNQLFQFSQVTTGEISGESLQLKGTNTFIKHEFNKDPDDPASDILIQLNNSYGMPMLAPFHSHVLGNEGLTRRVHNRFIDSKNNIKFEIQPSGPSIWRISGNFYNGFLCRGSVIKRGPGGDTFISATRQFGVLSHYLWRKSGDKIKLAGVLPGNSGEFDGSQKAENCPGMDSRTPSEIIQSLSYDNRIPVADGRAPFVDVISAAFHPVGTPVLVGGKGFTSIFTKDISDPQQHFIFEKPQQSTRNSEYYLINRSSTSRDDNGIVGLNVYKSKVGNDAQFVAKTSEMMVALALDIDAMNERRIKDSEEIAKKMEKDRWQLNLAERKANTIDTLSKVVVTGLAVATFDMVYRGLQGPAAAGSDGIARQGTKILGLNIAAGESLASTAINSPLFRERMLAAAYFTLATSTAMSAEITVATWEERSTLDQVKTFFKTLIPTGTSVGLKGIFKSGTAKWISIGTAGLLQRWRVLKGMEALGYQNGSIAQQVLNLGSGVTTEVLATYATSKGANAGTVGAIYGAGFLVGEIICGRGTPSLILGTTLEIGTNVLVKDPRIRPFAVVLSRQISALGQLGEAQLRSRATSQMLDSARANIYKHYHLVTTLIWLLKNVPEAFDGLEPEQKVFVLANAIDPYADLRIHYSGSI